MEIKLKPENVILTYQDICVILSNTNYSSEWISYQRICKDEYTEEDVVNYSNAKMYTSVVCFEDKLTIDLLKGKEILVLDKFEEEDEEPYVHKISLNDIKNAVALLTKEYPESLLNILSEQSDYTDDENIIQLAIFKELRY